MLSPTIPEKQNSEEKKSEISGTELSEVIPKEVGPEDDKLVRKRMKKKGMDEDEARHELFLKRNMDRVNKLYGEFSKKLGLLGFKLVGKLSVNEDGIVPEVKIGSFTGQEYKYVKDKLNEKKENT